MQSLDDAIAHSMLRKVVSDVAHHIVDDGTIYVGYNAIRHCTFNQEPSVGPTVVVVGADALWSVSATGYDRDTGRTPD